MSIATARSARANGILRLTRAWYRVFAVPATRLIGRASDTFVRMYLPERSKMILFRFATRSCLSLSAALAATLAFAQKAEIPEPVERTAERHITRDAIVAPIRFLASDHLEGRGPATRGD